MRVPLPPSLFAASLATAAALANPVNAADPPFYSGGVPDLPEIGESAAAVLTPAQEKRLGQAFMRSVRASEKVLADPLLVDYLQSLGSRLAAKAEAAGQSFTFFVIDDPNINAFAGPGGHIGVNTGLILATENENELAAVLAHEIAHVTQKHLLRTFEAASSLTLPQAAVLLAAVILGTAAGGGAGLAAALGGQAALLQQRINFTRSNEEEADRVGMQILAKSSFDPRAMPSFFERMGRSGQAYATQLPEFLRTHPVTTSRIADAQGRAENYSYRQRPDDLRYHLARAALQAQQPRTAQEAVANFRSTMRQGRYSQEAAERYGYAVALLRARDHEGARREIDQLRSADPSRVEYVVTSARLHAAAGNRERGLAELEQGLKGSPSSYPLRLELAEAALAAGRPARAREALEPLLRSRSDQPEVMRLMARAAAGSGRAAQGHRYQAEYYYLTGAVESAVQQLEIALRDPGLDFQQSSIIEARLHEVREEAADLKKEKMRTGR
jgi:predicted Zn-dependent protease